MLEVDNEVVEVRAGEVGVEDLPAPLRAPLVRFPEEANRLLGGQPEIGHGGGGAVLHRRDDPHLEDVAQALEQELGGESAVDTVAVFEALTEHGLHGEHVALLAAGEALEEVPRHVEAAVHLLLGQPVAPGGGDRLLPVDHAQAEAGAQLHGELVGSAVVGLGDRDDRHEPARSLPRSGPRRRPRPSCRRIAAARFAPPVPVSCSLYSGWQVFSTSGRSSDAACGRVRCSRQSRPYLRSLASRVGRDMPSSRAARERLPPAISSTSAISRRETWSTAVASRSSRPKAIA